ncbi:MAG: alpha/beta hydrolase [Candidatus Bathyarchaeota archaeon]|nr:MAG: alpha/beta hydrolase [Candidatus Bathyarchaeota archaeon]
MRTTIKHNFRNINGIRMHFVAQGEGELLILLHGFPDFWNVWRFQIPTLAKHYRVIAPDLRGYNKTDKPKDVKEYKLNILTDDIRELIKALGEEQAYVVGHDWGGVIAWSLAAFNPKIVKKLVILNAPHPNAFTARTKDSLRQLQMSWYVFFFQTPRIPEEVLSRNKFSFLKNMLRRSFINKRALREEDLEAYTNAWSSPGSLTAALNYYRANMNPGILFSEREIEFPKIQSPTLVLWGEQDVALSKRMIENTDDFMEAQYQIRYFANCGHWVQLEDPERVNRCILEFLKDS